MKHKDRSPISSWRFLEHITDYVNLEGEIGWASGNIRMYVETWKNTALWEIPSRQLGGCLYSIIHYITTDKSNHAQIQY